LYLFLLLCTIRTFCGLVTFTRKWVISQTFHLHIFLQFAGAVRVERKGKLEEKSSSTYGMYRAVIFLGKKGKIL